MNIRYSDEIKANLERAMDSLRAARLMFDGGFYDFAASRAYYAAFYAATSLLLAEGLEYSKHSGVIASIHMKFVKTERLSKEAGRNLNWLFELRNVGDYGETEHVPKDDAEKALDAAEKFYQAVRQMLAGI